jgi:hypothetical protein
MAYRAGGDARPMLSRCIGFGQVPGLAPPPVPGQNGNPPAPSPDPPGTTYPVSSSGTPTSAVSQTQAAAAGDATGQYGTLTTTMPGILNTVTGGQVPAAATLTQAVNAAAALQNDLVAMGAVATGAAAPATTSSPEGVSTGAAVMIGVAGLAVGALAWRLAEHLL